LPARGGADIVRAVTWRRFLLVPGDDLHVLRDQLTISQSANAYRSFPRLQRRFLEWIEKAQVEKSMMRLGKMEVGTLRRGTTMPVLCHSVYIREARLYVVRYSCIVAGNKACARVPEMVIEVRGEMGISWSLNFP